MANLAAQKPLQEILDMPEGRTTDKSKSRSINNERYLPRDQGGDLDADFDKIAEE